jgi:hypothetical protein
MNNIVSKLKNIWQYLASNPNTTPEMKQRFTALATKAKGMLAPKKQPEAIISPRQKVLDLIGKTKVKQVVSKQMPENYSKEALTNF